MVADEKIFFNKRCQYGKSAKIKNALALFTLLPKSARSGKIALFWDIMRQHNTVDNPVETVHNSDFTRIFQVYSAVMFWWNGEHFPPFSCLHPKKTGKSKKKVLPLVIVVKKVYNIQNFVL